MERFRLFVIWAGVLTGLWVFANWPRDGGILGSWMQWAGFPWTFAFWEDGTLRWFDPAAFAADTAAGAAVVIPIAWLCAWSRGRAPRSSSAAGRS